MSQAQETDPWTVYMTPSPTHELLSTYAGEFTMVLKMDGLDEPIRINSTHQMILGGRFLELRQTGEMMGMDYASIFTLGYNTIDSTFSLTTITNMGTGTLALQGLWDKASKTAIMYGKLTNPVSENTINVKQTLSFVNDNTLIIESFDQEGDLPEKRSVQYAFVRK